MTNLPFNGVFSVTCVYRKAGSWAAGFHTGIDLYGHTSPDVYSVCNGTVTMAKYYGDYGNAIKIKDSSTGKIFLFAHLKSFNVSVGQTVTRTTKIGVMGNTGNVSSSSGGDGTHLHIEMRTSSDVYGQVENIAAYMGIPNAVGQYNSANYQINTNVPNISYQAHVQNIGWQNPVSNGGIAGTTGQDLRIEAIKISSDIDIQYRVHMEGIGWGDWVPKDCIAGTIGESRKIEAIEIISSYNDFKGQAHVQYTGWMAEQVGTHITIGTTGQNLRLEAFKLQFLPK